MNTDPTPKATPTQRIEAVRARWAARIEDIEWMASTRETVPGSAARLHIHPHRLREFLAAADRRDLFGRLLATRTTATTPGPTPASGGPHETH